MLGGAFFQPETLFKKELLGLLVMVGKSEFGRKNGSYHAFDIVNIPIPSRDTN
jgi:hypothetical protein